MTATPPQDQIAELTRGLALPLPAIADVHMGVILETISQAWSELTTEDHAAMAEDEDAISNLLKTRLNYLLDTNRLWKSLVSSEVKGAESTSFDGKSLQKRPDLSLHLTSRSPNFPLVVECKIIDCANGKGVNLYCGNGIARFLDGRYAWANREGIIIGYVRDHSTIPEQLVPYLEYTMTLSSDPWATVALPSQATEVYPAAHQSEHLRKFSYLPAAGASQPGSIRLAHLWLKADPVG